MTTMKTNDSCENCGARDSFRRATLSEAARGTARVGDEVCDECGFARPGGTIPDTLRGYLDR